MRRAVLICLGFTLFAGCAGIPSSRMDRLRADAHTTHCAPPPALRHPARSARAVPPSAPLIENTPSGLNDFSPHAQEIARIIGVHGLLKELQTLLPPAEHDTDRDTLRRLHLRQQISDRITLAAFEVSSVVAEAGCEETRTDHLADGLTEIRSQREEIGLLVAIVGDALIGVVAGGLGLAAKNTASEIVAIIGGGLAAVFGTAAIFVGGEFDLHHSRNLLRDLYEGPQRPDLFPPIVWRYLNWPFTERQATIREDLVSHWRTEGRFGKAGSQIERRRLQLLFGTGGTYSIEELRDRAEMLDNLKGEVGLMNQDLNVLLQEILLKTGDQPLE